VKRFNKFGAKRSYCSAGHEHASKREATRCNELRILERAGEIAALEIEPQFYFAIDGRQVKHQNGRRAGYKPDFAYRLPDGRHVIEDVKGGNATRTEAHVLRIAIFRALFPAIELREVR
jgi:hypothetical protein